ncbi:MAG: manganese efflux pump [Clostridia bacterium]|nr:manganese efflux pump [Clostridia bacterium]
MEFTEIILISIGLAMDAFAVATCKGLAMKKMSWNKGIIVALYFGVFQAIMPVIGYCLGINFQDKIKNIDHWIAFILLTAIGINMIKEVWDNNKEENNDNVDFKNMVVLAIATSIDALAIGITFAFLKCNIYISAISIGTITFALSLIGVKIGNIFGCKYEKKAQILGGSILMVLGLKILLEHLQVL